MKRRSALILHARRLRKEQTEAERLIWQRLRDRKFFDTKWKRQVPFGSFIVDFCCAEQKIIIEVDGAGHLRRDTRRNDAAKERYLRSYGYRVLRFWNSEVFHDMNRVLLRIRSCIKA